LNPISTVAGTGIAGYNGDGIPATTAELFAPRAVAVDNHGDVFIADAANNRVREVTAAGTILTVAGTGTSGYSGDGGLATAAKLSGPRAVAVDSSGNLFIADANNNVIRKVTASTGTISTIAGTGTAGFNGDGIPATSAQLNFPQAVVLDNSGNLFIADKFNQRIRKVTAGTGTISTIAGNGIIGYNGDGIPATTAELKNPLLRRRI
jgi:hypothetical protein